MLERIRSRLVLCLVSLLMTVNEVMSDIFLILLRSLSLGFDFRLFDVTFGPVFSTLSFSYGWFVLSTGYLHRQSKVFYFI